MQFSRRSDYSVRAMMDVATMPAGSLALTHEIASRQDIPSAFLTKIVGRLTQEGLLRTYRGAFGGVILARQADQITLRQIIEAVEGPINLMWCMAQSGECQRDATCPVHEVWHQAQDELLRRLDSVTLADLVKRKAVLQAQAEA